MNTPNFHKLALGFITYNPTPEFFRRLRSSCQHFQVYVFDNSPDFDQTRIICHSLTNVTYITAGKNIGLGVGLSVINGTAFSDDNEMLLFFDQDTEFTTETLNYISLFAELPSRNFETEYAAIAFSAERDAENTLYSVRESDLIISSGSFYFLKNLKKIGWHNEAYFVDGVDYEMCLRAVSHGLKVGICGNTPGFDHRIEQPDRILSVFGKELPLRRYSKARIIDAMSAYKKLIVNAVYIKQFRIAGVLIRSFAIYSVGQILSRLFLKEGC